MHQEHVEAEAEKIHGLLANHLRTVLEEGTATAADARIALDFVKYNRVKPPVRKPGSPSAQLEDALSELPFQDLD